MVGAGSKPTLVNAGLLFREDLPWPWAGFELAHAGIESNAIPAAWESGQQFISL